MTYTEKLTITPKQAVTLCKYIRRHIASIECDNLHHSRKDRHKIGEPCPVEDNLFFAIDAILSHLERLAK
jgi:hypothetical protein